MRASEVYALHVEEERYHQAHEYLERASRALPPGSPARAALDALAASIEGEWRATREAIIRLHQLSDETDGESHPSCYVPPATTTTKSCARASPAIFDASLTLPASL